MVRSSDTEPPDHPSPRDALFRRVFADARSGAALLRCIVPAELATRVDRPRREYPRRGWRVLVRLLRQRFGEVSDEQERRIRDASLGQLDRWADRLLTARSLDEIGA